MFMSAVSVPTTQVSGSDTSDVLALRQPAAHLLPTSAGVQAGLTPGTVVEAVGNVVRAGCHTPPYATAWLFSGEQPPRSGFQLGWFTTLLGSTIYEPGILSVRKLDRN